VAEDRRLDGNAIAGALLELFGTEMTVAVGICGGCGTAGELAETDVYADAPGIVVRCRHCHAVLATIVRGRDRTWLNLSGFRSVEIPGTNGGVEQPGAVPRKR
jgi:Family of unknown function (DUF6510)